MSDGAPLHCSVIKHTTPACFSNNKCTHSPVRCFSHPHIHSYDPHIHSYDLHIDFQTFLPPFWPLPPSPPLPPLPPNPLQKHGVIDEWAGMAGRRIAPQHAYTHIYMHIYIRGRSFTPQHAYTQICMSMYIHGCSIKYHTSACIHTHLYAHVHTWS